MTKRHTHICLLADNEQAITELAMILSLSGNKPYFTIHAPPGSTWDTATTAMFAGKPRYTRYLKRFSAGIRIVADGPPDDWVRIAWPFEPEPMPPPERTAEELEQAEESKKRVIALLADIRAGRHVP